MPIITISRGTMSGGQALAESLALSLNIPCVGREILMEAAEKIGVSQEVLRDKMEKMPGLWERLTSERQLYVAAVQAALLDLTVHGDLVYHGQAGHMLLKGVPGVLRIRLIAPIELRLRAVMVRQGMLREEAQGYIAEVDESRVRWTKFMYGVDLRDPILYDLIINLETMSIETASALVRETVSRPEFLITAERREGLRNLALASKVNFALARNPGTRGLELSIAAHEGTITVTGFIPSVSLLASASRLFEQELVSIIQRVEGVKAVDLMTRPAGPVSMV